MPLSNITGGGSGGLPWIVANPGELQLPYDTKRNDGQTPKHRELIQEISWESMFWSAVEPLLSKFNGLLSHYSWETRLHSNSSVSIGWVFQFLNFTGIRFGPHQIAFVGFKLCRKGKDRSENELELRGLLLLLGRRSSRQALEAQVPVEIEDEEPILTPFTPK